MVNHPRWLSSQAEVGIDVLVVWGLSGDGSCLLVSLAKEVNVVRGGLGRWVSQSDPSNGKISFVGLEQ